MRFEGRRGVHLDTRHLLRQLHYLLISSSVIPLYLLIELYHLYYFLMQHTCLFRARRLNASGSFTHSATEVKVPAAGDFPAGSAATTTWRTYAELSKEDHEYANGLGVRNRT